MLTIDANILLRYAPNDNAKLSAKAQEIIESNTCYVPLLALAGMGFVLGLVYEAKPAEVVAYNWAGSQAWFARFEANVGLRCVNLTYK